MTEPYLDGAPRAAFDVWQERARARFSPPLTFQELRRGVQALCACAALGGLLVATYLSTDSLNVAPGPTIVLLALACFVLAWPTGLWLRSRETAHA